MQPLERLATGRTVWGSNPGVGEIFRAVQTGPEDYSASCTMDTGCFLGIKWPEHRADHPPPCSAEVTYGLDLYIHLPSVALQTCHRASFLLNSNTAWKNLQKELVCNSI
jgi:hypothetical protein